MSQDRIFIESLILTTLMAAITLGVAGSLGAGSDGTGPTYARCRTARVLATNFNHPVPDCSQEKEAKDESFYRHGSAWALLVGIIAFPAIYWKLSGVNRI